MNHHIATNDRHDKDSAAVRKAILKDITADMLVDILRVGRTSPTVRSIAYSATKRIDPSYTKRAMLNRHDEHTLDAAIKAKVIRVLSKVEDDGGNAREFGYGKRRGFTYVTDEQRTLDEAAEVERKKRIAAVEGAAAELLLNVDDYYGSTHKVSMDYRSFMKLVNAVKG